MKISSCIQCDDFPCKDVDTNVHLIPSAEVDPQKIKIIMISEAPPVKVEDDFYSFGMGKPFYVQTTCQAFQDAGSPMKNMQQILGAGIYITTAIKCAKKQYAVSTETIKACSLILERELAMFLNIQAYMLMGDVAIKALNYISKRNQGKRVIPPGPTYKIRHGEFYYGKIRVFPSYLQTGKNYLIEKSKRRMIAEDIKATLQIIG